MSGIFILSLDTEIAWGTYGARNLLRSSDCFNRYRDYFPRLVALLDQYAIPATWALVAHLLLEHCDGHDDVPQPHYAWAPAPDSYRDPCTDLERAPWYYGPDIVAQIRAARTSHEIGTHTFTHVIAGDPAVTATHWDAQLRKATELHAAHGLPPIRSLVYPRNRVAYVDMLRDYGIVAYRGAEVRWYHSLPRPARRVCYLLDWARAAPPPTYDPARLIVGERLVNLPASQFLLAYDGLRSAIPTRVRVRQAQQGLQAAQQNGRIFHLWFHPFNLGSSPKMFDALEAILAEVARRRDAGGLRVLTMADAAEWILQTHAGEQRWVTADGWT